MTCKFKISFTWLIIVGALISCIQKGVIVTPSQGKIKNSTGCFAMLGERVEDGGIILQNLCGTDIDKILSFANLSPSKSEKIRELICGSEGSPESFKKFFDSLSPKEKRDLIRGFELFGYSINGYGC